MTLARGGVGLPGAADDAVRVQFGTRIGWPVAAVSWRFCRARDRALWAGVRGGALLEPSANRSRRAGYWPQPSRKVLDPAWSRGQRLGLWAVALVSAVAPDLDVVYK